MTYYLFTVNQKCIKTITKFQVLVFFFNSKFSQTFKERKKTCISFKVVFLSKIKKIEVVCPYRIMLYVIVQHLKTRTHSKMCTHFAKRGPSFRPVYHTTQHTTRSSVGLNLLKIQFSTVFLNAHCIRLVKKRTCSTYKF